MKISWFTRLIAIAILLSWLGAAYHDVWLEAAKITHHHGHAHHHHDHDSDEDDSQPTSFLPDFHTVTHLTKTSEDDVNISNQAWTCIASALWVIWTEYSVEDSSDPPPPDIGNSPFQANSLLLEHSVHPNAPPVFA